MSACETWRSRERIALIEDDEHLALMLRYNFEAWGYEVFWIDDGGAAIERLLQIKPALIVVDWTLPSLAGIEVLRRLRASPELCSIPAVMLTGRATPQDRARAIATGADMFFAKPASIELLFSAFQDLLKRDVDTVGRNRHRLKLLDGQTEDVTSTRR